MRKITRKLCMFLLTWVSVSLLYAQQDVTATYLNNADFDENPTFAESNGEANGTKNENGYDIPGWATYLASWGRVATANYGITFTTAPDVLNGVNPPATDINGNSEGAVLMMSGSWAGIVQLTQQVTLPAGKYELVFDVIAQDINKEVDANYLALFLRKVLKFIVPKMNLRMTGLPRKLSLLSLKKRQVRLV